jgi:pimeloyl-ACP methyl ester carboxylesterase
MTEVQTITIGDMKVRVSGSGFPLIFVHDYTNTSEFWREQIAEFSDSYLVIRPNLPGHGISPRPATRSYSIDAFVNDIEGIFHQLSLRRVVLVGLSMGGVVAQQVAIENPEFIQALVLVNTASHASGPDISMEKTLAAIDEFGVAAISQNLAVRSFASGTPPSLVEWAKHEVIRTPEFVAREAVVSLNTSDMRTTLRRISVPTLVVAGEQDVLTTPLQSKELADGIPDSMFVVIEHAGHFPMLERPLEFNRVLRTFLDQHARPFDGDSMGLGAERKAIW